MRADWRADALTTPRQSPMLKTFAHHKPGAAGLAKITRLREAFSSVASLCDELCPESREAAVAITRLEEGAMWAIKAVVVNDPESEVERPAPQYVEARPRTC